MYRLLPFFHYLTILEWTATADRTGIEGFYIAVRGHIEQFHEPKVWFSTAAEKFVKDILDMEPKRLALQMESYVVSGLEKSE
jgi:hypothetical protein